MHPLTAATLIFIIACEGVWQIIMAAKIKRLEAAAQLMLNAAADYDQAMLEKRAVFGALAERLDAQVDDRR